MAGEQGHREQRGVGGACRTDGEGGHRDARGHLHDRVQRIHTIQMFAGHRHTEHRHHGLGRQHPRQVGSTARAGNDGAQAARHGLVGEGKHIVGHAVCRHDTLLIRNLEAVQHLGGVAQDFPVAGRAHHDAEEGVHYCRITLSEHLSIEDVHEFGPLTIAAPIRFQTGLAVWSAH